MGWCSCSSSMLQQAWPGLAFRLAFLGFPWLDVLRVFVAWSAAQALAEHQNCILLCLLQPQLFQVLVGSLTASSTGLHSRQ